MESLFSKNKQFDINLGEFLRYERLQKNLTLEDLIQKSGLQLSRSSLSNIELGKQQVSSYQLFLILTALDSDFKKVFDYLKKEINKFKHFEPNVKIYTKNGEEINIKDL